MTVRQFNLAADSIGQGTQGGFNYALGGGGCWFELVAERIANLAGIGPLLSSGIRLVHLGFTASTFPSEWTVPGGGSTGTTVLSTDAFDRYPYGLDGRWANGSTFIWTWTKWTGSRSNVGFDLYYVNKSGGGTNGGPQYRIDGGTWTNFSQSAILSPDNLIWKFYVNTPITATLDIRAFDGTSGVDCFPIGIQLWYSAPSTSQGCIFHNIGVNGMRLDYLVTATSGDRMAIFDSVQLGSGSPVSPTPNAGVLMIHINDVNINNTTTWANDLTTFNTRMSALGTVGLMNPWECNISSANQASYRSQLKTTAAGFGTPAKVFDDFDALNNLGYGGVGAQNAVISANGYLIQVSDGIHPAQYGDFDVATRVYWFIRNQFLSLGNIPSTYTATAKQATVAYSGKVATPAYAACAPVSVA